MSKINTIITFNDSNIGILLFNQENIILFQDKVKLEKNIILNGMINNIKDVIEKVSTLISEAENFVGTKITQVYSSFDVSDIEVKPFQLNNIKLPNGIFNQLQWDLLKKSIKIDQSAHKYIYDIVYETWIIDNKKQTITENQIAGNNLDVEANMFQINKVIYSQYLNVFERLKIQATTLKPLLNDFVNLPSSIKTNHFELNVYLNEKSIIIVLTEGKKIKRCVTDMSLGLSKLYEMIHSETKLEIGYIEELITNIWAHFGNFQNVQMINDLSDKMLCASTTDSDHINHIISSYIKSLVNFVEVNADFLNTNLGVVITRINYLSFNKFTSQMFNQVNIYSKINSRIITNRYIEEYGPEFTQEWLLMESVTKNQTKASSNFNVEKKTSKIFKDINKG
ncbi:MAG: hypothetical protein ACRC4M_03450 [Mycoplasma sp.]